MKTRKWSFYWAIALTVLCSWSCTEWGLTDPPAGNQIYPKLEQKGVLDFEEELLPETFTLMAYSEGEIPTIISDAEKGKVLQLQGGYAQISNPLYGVKVQTGLSLTFWAKSEANNSGALFSFASEDNADKLFFTPSLELSYTGSPQNINLHTASTSSLLDDESWHYVAISVKNDGFLLHVDGKMVVDTLFSDELVKKDYADLVQHITAMPYLYLGYGGITQPKAMWIDDVKIYRNVITAKEIAMPDMSGGAANQYLNLGEEDYSTPFWSVFSPVLSASGDCIFSYEFINNTKGINNWENWILVVTNGKGIGEDGCEELLVLRADAFGWGAQYESGTLTSDYNWDTFKADMQGAKINLTVKREGSRFEMTAITHKVSGGTCTYTFVHENFPTGTLGTLFTLEAAHLQIDKYETTMGKLYKEGSYVVGNTDCSTAWWTAFSSVVAAEGDNLVNIEFKNYTDGANNWNNWLLILTNGIDIGGSGVAEYFVMRSDAYGWGDYMILDNMTNTFNFDTFKTDMNGAKVSLTSKRIGERYDMNAIINKAAGGTMEYNYFHDEFPTGPMGNVLTIEGGYLDVLSVSTAPFINHK